VEPLHPALREALKAAHPGLTDEVIDESQELLAQQVSIDAKKDPDLYTDLTRSGASSSENTCRTMQKSL